MSGKPWDKAAAAKALDERTNADLSNFDLSSPIDFFKELRWYLQRTTDTGRTRNGVHMLSRRTLDTGDTQINAGPTIFRDPCDTCIRFSSGARLAFGIILRAVDGKTTLLSYRFHLHLLPRSGLGFLRIDLNAPKGEYDPLHQPRSHMHPGFEGIHIPFRLWDRWKCWTVSFT